MFPSEPLLADGSETGYYLVGGAIIFLGGIVFIAIFARYFSLWIQCKMTRAGIGLLDLIMMSFRKVNTSVIVRGKIMSVQAGLDPITNPALGAHFLSNGHVPPGLPALIAPPR